MAQDGKIIAFNIDDLKIRKVLTDPSGGSNTFGDWVDFFGVQGFQLSPEYIEQELPGDGTTLDIFSKLKNLVGQFTGQMSFKAMEILFGGSAAYTGSSPNEKGVYTISASDLPNFFELDAQCLYRGGTDASGGDFHIGVFKAKITSFQYSMANEEYALLTVDWKAVPRLTDGKFGQFVENETKVDLAEGAADTTPPTVSSTSPNDAATGVLVGANITFTFSEAIVFDNSQFSLYKVVSATDLTAVAFSASISGNTVTLNPSSDLDASSNYVAMAKGVRDLAGNQLASPSVVNFTTA